MKVILNSVPYQRLNPDLDLTPDPQIVVSGEDELKTMVQQHIESGEFTD